MISEAAARKIAYDHEYEQLVMMYVLGPLLAVFLLYAVPVLWVAQVVHLDLAWHSFWWSVLYIGGAGIWVTLEVAAFYYWPAARDRLKRRMGVPV
jgi:hypothetical protein